jgi:hypothetical protein
MSAHERIFHSAVLVIGVAWVAVAQNSSTARKASTVERVQPLVLTDAILLEGVKGRFDHFGYGRGRVLWRRWEAMPLRLSASAPERWSTLLAVFWRNIVPLNGHSRFSGRRRQPSIRLRD